ncbi:Hypothetical predicted protein [Mytilus galloprovincialis]|uniref:DUF547 domain-containing protein n=1 Tax=Mytilus galloprovincialis TaxID=29158 RepID=A0A8B6DNY9_MYTGA|nr:Hypothetical predicted protein [Mytilus galloprovincialis]
MASSPEPSILNQPMPQKPVANPGQTPAKVSAVELSKKLQKCMLRLKGEYMGNEGQGVDYEKLRLSQQFKEYEELTSQLQNVNLTDLSENEKKAFFINLYNALTIHAGHTFSLDDIEHGILRGNKPHPSSMNPPFNPKDLRLKFVCTLDPRIHFALVCGAVSCPVINVYTAENLDRALEDATKNFCKQEVSMFTETDEIWLSKIFQWYMDDFGKTDLDVIKWTIPYLELNIQERAWTLLAKLQSYGTVDVKYNEYDWRLNRKGVNPLIL